MGWFDAVATRHGVQVQGATQVALTVVDALGYLKEIPVCVGYEVDSKTCGTSQQPHVRAVQAGAGGFAWLELRYSGALPGMRICPPTAELMWNSLKRRWAFPLPWSPTVLAGPRSFTGNDAECSGVLFALDSTPDFFFNAQPKPAEAVSLQGGCQGIRQPVKVCYQAGRLFLWIVLAKGTK